MYKLKQIPEDFIVKEMAELQFSKEGRYGYYLLWKKDYNTVSACKAIARRMRMKPKFINFSGTKDRQAVTEQYISISLGPKRNLEMDGIRLEYLGRGDERLNLGTHIGNEFEIVVRNISEEEYELAAKRIEMLGAGKMVLLNYFDEQRFGRNKNNHAIGKHLLKKEYKQACDMIDDEKLSEHLLKYPNDYVNALRMIPKKILQIYAHSYQSYLWNKVCGNMVKEECKKFDEIDPGFGKIVFAGCCLEQKEIEVYGFDSEENEVYSELLAEEDLSRLDFANKQLKELNLEGDSRKMLMDAHGFVIDGPEHDELNPGKKKTRVRFKLGKGSYATMVIRQIFLDSL